MEAELSLPSEDIGQTMGTAQKSSMGPRVERFITPHPHLYHCTDEQGTGPQEKYGRG